MAIANSLRFRLAALAAGAVGLVAAGAATAATAIPRDVSSNWSGYVVTGASFSSVTGTWVQPEIDCTATGTGATAFWVGLGGNSLGSNALEQAGTGAECLDDGTARHYAWYELVPAPSVEIPLTVEPGDTITATVTVVGTKVTMQVANVTRGAKITKVKQIVAPDTSSAEWVAEAPSLCTTSGHCRTVALPDFGKVKFTKASATAAGHTGGISDRAWTATSIQLVSDLWGPGYGRYAATNSTGTQAIPSSLSARGSAFSVKWQASTVATTATAPPAPSWP